MRSLAVWGAFALSLMAGAHAGLYGPDDGIVVLTDSDYKAVVFGSDTVWLVEFYAEWCGHCQHFAPIYKEFAVGAKRWSDFVRIAAIHCPDNNAACQDNDIHGYPTLKMFGLNATTSKDAQVYTGPRGDPEQLREGIASQVLKMHPQAPNEALTATPGMVRSWSAGEFAEEVVVIVFGKDEEDTRNRAAATVLDMHGHDVKVVAGCEDCKAALSVTKPGTAVVLKKDHIHERRVYEDYKAADLAASVLKLLPGGQDAPGAHVPPSSNEHFKVQEIDNQGSVVREQTVEVTNQVHIYDLATVLYRILRTEVPALLKRLDASHVAVLSDFLTAVADAFPLKQARSSIKKLQTTIHESVTAGMDMPKYKAIVMEWRLEGLDLDPDTGVMSPRDGVLREYWVTCKGSSPRYRGYTCGLWLLLHTLTINCHPGTMAYATKVTGRQTCGGDLVFIIRDFISAFFTCIECRQHFGKAVDKIAEDAPGWTKEEAAPWLWRVHNIVNNRLREGESTDPYVPKVQYPPAALCDTCLGTASDEPSWNENEVYKFLVRHYTDDLLMDVGTFWLPYSALQRMLYWSTVVIILLYMARLWQKNKRTWIIMLRRLGKEKEKDVPV